MKTKLLTKPVAAFIALLVLSGLAGSCSFQAAHVGSVSSASPEPPPLNQRTPPQTTSPLPPPTGFVNDYANVLDAESRTRLESALADLKRKSDIEFAVATIETTGSQTLFDYSLAVARGWGIGPKDTSKGGGLLLMLAVKDRGWRIQVGRSLEKDLPDEECKKLGAQSEVLYRQQRYAEGIIKYVKAIIERLEKLRGFKLDNEIWKRPIESLDFKPAQP
ncbi:MAG: uncharacterized protein QOD75_469 [Blastocatellia bacterium]|jgi:uncharacterized membrane protein YgcG|nr:uncharacterized protein [Blastocatellia bacterium]